MKPSEKLAELKLALPPFVAPIGSYIPGIRTGNLVLVSGQLPFVEGKLTCTGKVGQDVTLEQANAAARTAGLNALGIAAHTVGGLGTGVHGPAEGGQRGERHDGADLRRGGQARPRRRGGERTADERGGGSRVDGGVWAKSMRRAGLRKWTHHSLAGVIAFSGIATAFISVFLKSDATYWDPKAPWLADLLRLSQQLAPVVLPILMAVSFVAAAVMRRIGNPWVWTTVKGLLDQFRELVFRDRAAGDHQHAHRATLFKHVRIRFCLRRWPWSGWLIPVERSGYTTRKCKVAFLAPDGGGNAEGIAGRTWSENAQVSAFDLPDISKDSNERTLKKYAEKGFVDILWLREWLRHETGVARSFRGIPIEVKGRTWGILVLDSTKPEQIGKDNEELYDMIAWSLGKLLEKG